MEIGNEKVMQIQFAENGKWNITKFWRRKSK